MLACPAKWRINLLTPCPGNALMGVELNKGKSDGRQNEHHSLIKKRIELGC
jgi:hypothetical protein